MTARYVRSNIIESQIFGTSLSLSLFMNAALSAPSEHSLNAFPVIAFPIFVNIWIFFRMHYTPIIFDCRTSGAEKNNGIHHAA